MYKLQMLNAISPVYEGILKASEYQAGTDVADPDAILVRSANMHEMPINEKLLCVGRAGAGVNNIPLDKMAEAGVVVFNSPGANANAVKELVVAGLLLASRKINDGIAWCKTLDGKEDLDKLVEKGKNQFVGPELAGKTLGVIGLGAIGILVANMGVSLGMDVLGYDPYISVDHAWKLSRSVEHVTDLNYVLENSDYITMHLPLIDSTKGMIDADAIARMKPGAALLNFARGGLVQADDVQAALHTGKLRAYVTDFPAQVFMNEPNAIQIPHLGASTPESEDNCVVMVANQIDAYLKTGSIINSVNYPNCPLGKLTMPRVAILHKNVPNVISAISSCFSSEGLNIELMVNQSRGSIAYTVADVNTRPSDAILDHLRALDSTYRVRLLMP